jgi:hypothetical protein
MSRLAGHPLTTPKGLLWWQSTRKEPNPMTLEDLLARLLPILPNLLLDEESDGEVLIYTGFRQTQDGRLEGVGG